MAIKRYKPEQIVTLLRQIEVGMANGKPTPQACNEAEITVQTYYRWGKEYGGLKLEPAKRTCGGACAAAVCNDGTTRLPIAGAVARDAAVRAHPAQRRGCV
jgi:Transposase